MALKKFTKKMKRFDSMDDPLCVGPWTKFGNVRFQFFLKVYVTNTRHDTDDLI